METFKYVMTLHQYSDTSVFHDMHINAKLYTCHEKKH
jgi:hypothetical protein